jgi:hypothetical protein
MRNYIGALYPKQTARYRSLGLQFHGGKCRICQGMTDAPRLNPSRSSALGFWLLLSLLCILAAAKVVLGDTLDPDCFWHLRVADEIAKGGWPRPIVDDLSFASIRQPWTPYSWLAELAMKWLWDVAGYRGAIAAQALMEMAFILLLGLCALELTAKVHTRPRYLAAAVSVAFGAILSLAYLSFRPVTAALTILALIAWLLLRDRRLDHKSRSVWIVIPLTALLINIHFFALFVPLWTAALLIGDLLETKLIPVSPSAGTPGEGKNGGRIFRSVFLFLLTLLSCLATPLLAGTLHSIIEYSTGDVMVRAGGIAEFRPFYLGILGNITAGIVIAMLVSAIWRSFRSPRMGLGETVWLFASAVLLFRMGRFAPVFAIIAVPTLAVVLPRLSDAILARPAVVVLLAAVLTLSIWKVASAFPPSNEPLAIWLNRNGPDAPNYPCAAADFVAQNVSPQTHRLLNEFSWGGYLEWSLGSRYQTLMDGRTQLFSPGFWNSTMLGSADDRARFLSSTPADAAILRTTKSKFEPVLTHLGWKIVYRDQFAEVLTPPSSALAAISNSN